MDNRRQTKIQAMTRKIAETSREAYNSLEPEKIQQIYVDIMKALSIIGEGTFEDISAYLKIDKSRVWKRLSEMQKNGMIFNTGRKRLLKSNRNGFTWMLTTNNTPKTDKEENVFRKQTTFNDHVKNINQITQPTLFT